MLRSTLARGLAVLMLPAGAMFVMPTMLTRPELPPTLATAPSTPVPAPAARSVGALQPVRFEPNQGQAPRAVRYFARGPRHQVSIFDDGAAFARAGAPLTQLRFVGARTGGTFTPREQAAAVTHHLIGNDSTRWQRAVPGYHQLRYEALYPGIDLVWYSRGGDLEFDFVVHPGADPGVLRLRSSGAAPPVIDADGRLRLDGEGGMLVVERPVLQQHIGGQRHTLDGAWTLHADGTIGFVLPEYDRRHLLVIDPVVKLLYSSYLGGVHDEQVGAMVLDVQGNAYVVGHSGSEDWPVAGNAVQKVRKNLGSYVRNVVVTKFDAAGTLLWSTFLGGSVNDYGKAIVLDAKGQVVIAGGTNSGDFPTTVDASQRQLQGGGGGFIAVLSPDGSQLVHSTLYGGAGGADIGGARLDAAGKLWLAGAAGRELPTTAGSLKATFVGNGNAAFVARFSAPAAGPLRLEAATYYGIDNPPSDRFYVGSNALGLALAPNGSAVWIAGQARHELLPVTANRLQDSPPATDHNAQVGALPLCAFAYVARLSADLSTLEFASYLSGNTREARDRSSCSEYARTVHTDSAGNAYVSGSTSSDRFPTTTGALQASYPGAGGFIGHVGFLTKISGSANPTIVWSTYLGGRGGDTFVTGHLVDDARAGVWVHGFTSGGVGFPISSDAQQASYGGGQYDGALVQLDAATGALRYGSFVGGAGADTPEAMALDAIGNTYLAGHTESRNFPVTANAFQGAYTANAFDGSDWFFQVVGSGTIGQVQPARGAGGGDITLSVATAGFGEGASAALIAADGTVYPARAVAARAGAPTRMTFNLDGAAPGAYTLRVSRSDGSNYSRSAAYTVVAGEVAAPSMSAQIIGRPKIRSGVPSTFQITVSNNGSQDAYVVPVWLELPESVTLTAYGFDAARGETLTTVEAGKRYFNHLIPRITAGETVALPVVLTASVNLESIPLTVSLQRPWFRTLADFTAEFPGFALGNYTPDCVNDSAHPGYANCFGTYLLRAGAGLRSLAPPAGASGAAASVAPGRERALGSNSACQPPGTGPFEDGKRDGKADAEAGNSNRYNPPNIKSDPVGSFLYNVGYTTGVLTAISAAAGGSSSAAAPRVDARRLGLNTVRPLNHPDCQTGHPPPSPPPTHPDSSQGQSSSAGAIDPNDKYGPAGDGSAGHFMRRVDTLPYQIAFENLASAGLPAAEVVVTDQLDPAKFDLATLSLGDVHWGTQRISVPPGLNSYSTIHPIDSTISVRVSGSLNPTTGVLKWTFTTLDPLTKLPPSDPTLGFLPPNRNGSEGQGYVNFTIRSKAGLPDGTRWENLASIVFDTNAPIVTPTWVNTLDMSPPSSRVNSASQRSGGTDVDLAWSGSDAGSGVARYSVSVAVDGGAFSVWRADTTDTSAVYPAAAGRRYDFVVTAVDKAGNAEATKTVAEAGLTVRDPAAGGGGGGGAFGFGRLGPWQTIWLLLAVAAALCAWPAGQARRRR